MKPLERLVATAFVIGGGIATPAVAQTNAATSLQRAERQGGEFPSSDNVIWSVEREGLAGMIGERRFAAGLNDAETIRLLLDGRHVDRGSLIGP